MQRRTNENNFEMGQFFWIEFPILYGLRPYTSLSERYNYDRLYNCYEWGGRWNDDLEFKCLFIFWMHWLFTYAQTLLVFSFLFEISLHYFHFSLDRSINDLLKWSWWQMIAYGHIIPYMGGELTEIRFYFIDTLYTLMRVYGSPSIK